MVRYVRYCVKEQSAATQYLSLERAGAGVV